ncbi:tRNA (guanosine(46)-N7)-methyltransferase TrmB [Culicoidibacter larvae]|uniref:tRNA (guanine-N(7)-)-methyltransferase n=1 Tax=Culicoidibacter larvae TaxID=2579976 RepID=A0A5R8QFT6_9FIRM|nr:tRNA (guanosine(46)-N7)-methyltransferase TrmB [Culicoidibacter larvae]TLG76654.1 tRNA (guanosine(46)-N7)-methyltransferase TrmB [Culicoidibacter larvae]
MRLRNIPYAKEKLANHPELVILDGSVHKGAWHEVFGNSNPIAIEIGMGKGRFVIEMAKAHPAINFIGIERFDSVLVRALERGLEDPQCPPNLRFLHLDAELLTDNFADAEVTSVYLNFSDPWPKKRHAKRRLTAPQFLSRYQQILMADGYVCQKTDNMHLFESSLLSVNNYGMELLMVSLDLHNSDFEGNIMTEYEEKFAAKGQPIYRLEAKFAAK